MTRYERLKAGLLRPGEVARASGVSQSVLCHHYQSGHIPWPERIDARWYYTMAQARVIKRFFQSRKKYDRAPIVI